MRSRLFTNFLSRWSTNPQGEDEADGSFQNRVSLGSILNALDWDHLRAEVDRESRAREEGMRHSLTIVAVGILSYVYGIVTNIIGIWVAQGSPDVTNSPLVMLFPAILGFLLEVAPEPLFMWGLVGTGVRDLLGHLIGGAGAGGYDNYDETHRRERTRDDNLHGPKQEW